MLAGFEKRQFTSDAMGGPPVTHDIYEKGTGPVIIVLQELPGIDPATIKFTDRLADAGFRVVMPHLFGKLNKFALGRNMARLFCVRREINMFAKNRTSPIVSWLRALCHDVRKRYDVDGVGVIGMCLTGNFAISMMADEAVLGAVASQPSLPVFAQSSLHMSDADISEIRDRLDEKGTMLSYKFDGDKLCTGDKFRAIDAAFNTDRERIKLTTLPGNDHAMLTGHFNDTEGSPTQQALAEILDYFHGKLPQPEAKA